MDFPMAQIRTVVAREVRIKETILHEINEMILGYDFQTWEHYDALVWFKEQLKKGLEQ